MTDTSKWPRELHQEAYDALEKLPHLKGNIRAMWEARGRVMEGAINVEGVFNLLLDLSPVHYSKIDDYFRKKAGYVKEFIQKNDTDGHFNQLFFDKLHRAVLIRNLFAHVPFDESSVELTFTSEEPYARFFEELSANRNVAFYWNDFVKIGEEIVEELGEFVLVLAERHKFKQS